MPNVSGFTCGVDWAPLTSIANQIVYGDYEGINGYVYRATEGANAAGTQLINYDGANLLYWLKWLPDASGILVSIKESDTVANIYEYDFATQQVKQLTNFTNEYAGHFSVSPDGQYIAFDRYTDLANNPEQIADLWIMNRDGSNMRLLARNAARPSWSQRQPLIFPTKSSRPSSAARLTRRNRAPFLMGPRQ